MPKLKYRASTGKLLHEASMKLVKTCGCTVDCLLCRCTPRQFRVTFADIVWCPCTNNEGSNPPRSFESSGPSELTAVLSRSIWDCQWIGVGAGGVTNYEFVDCVGPWASPTSAVIVLTLVSVDKIILYWQVEGPEGPDTVFYAEIVVPSFVDPDTLEVFAACGTTYIDVDNGNAGCSRDFIAYGGTVTIEPIF